jgi:hypothetical protein
MTETSSFINALSEARANYNNPEQAITTSNLCDTISRDINTDSQRFVYELLQNADDASNEEALLDIRIDFVSPYVIVSHKGSSFSEVDIESISSAGDGTKTADINKTGFKGIGFKSVFSHSNLVIIKSGGYCFKFDKQHWTDYWNPAWGSEKEWKFDRRHKNKDESLKMPWQIIPICSDIPPELEGWSIFKEYNVSTIIKYDETEELKEAINKLFSESQIVLFLRSRQVKVIINTGEETTLEKHTQKEFTVLKRNGAVISEWLIRNDIFPIPTEVQAEINKDDKSPKKLKESTKTEISFAIRIENGKLKAVEEDNRLIFTYLPTSINFDFPFLVNATFLTDAGREHLHQDTYWNNWLFQQIPIKYFTWIAELADRSSPFRRQILSVLPHKLGTSKLEISFNNGYVTAIENIAFLPNDAGILIKVNDSIFDQTRISSIINPQTIVNYLNRTHQRQFTVSSFVSYLDTIRTLKKLGTTIFGLDDLEGLFISDTFVREHKLHENFKLIEFLYEQSHSSKRSEDGNEWHDVLRQTRFVFDEKEVLQRPVDIYYPSIEFAEDLSQSISVVHTDVLSRINERAEIKGWLEELGVKEPTDVNFIEKTLIGQGESFVQGENAIEVGRYLFKAHKKGQLLGRHYEKLHGLMLITQGGNLLPANKTYLSDFYNPELKIESIYKKDIFVSDKYYENSDLEEEWKAFFRRIGVKNQLEWESFIVSKSEALTRRDVSYFQPIISLMDGQSKYSNFGQYYYSLTGFKVYHFSFVDYVTDNLFAKLFWNNVFKLNYEGNSEDMVIGWSGNSTWPRHHGISSTAGQKSYFIWSIENLALFPTRDGQLMKAADVLINSSDIVELAGGYLPVLDYDDVVPEPWLKILPFRRALELDDLLKILEELSKGHTSDEAEIKARQKTVSKVYGIIANNYIGYVEKLKNWAKTNRLMANNGKDFYLANELFVVTILGFRSSNLAFYDNNSPEIINLLRLFGVRVIDSVKPIISNSKVEITDLKTKLIQTAPLIALVSVEKSKNRKDWELEYERIVNKLSTITFYETTEITLSYGDENDSQSRSSWSDNDDFYYVGKWYSPRVMDGLVEPLGNFLNIRYAERILTVILLESISGGVEYLTEKGFDISLVPEELLKMNNSEFIPPMSTGNTNPDVEDYLADLGRQGELAVFERLKQIYSRKYGQEVIETTTGFRIGSTLEVLWKNIAENTTANHDFKVVENGKETYIDSKATTFDKNMEKVALFITGNELALMESAEKYLIARVYNAAGFNRSVEFVRLNVENMEG